MTYGVCKYNILIMKIAIFIFIIHLYMLGGQVKTYYRRYVLPVLASLLSYFMTKNRRSARILALIIPMVMGYGQDSWLSKYFKQDWERRLVYSILVCVAVALYNFSWYLVLIPIAYQVRAGGFKIGKYDFLFEDMARSGAIAYCIVA